LSFLKKFDVSKEFLGGVVNSEYIQ